MTEIQVFSEKDDATVSVWRLTQPTIRKRFVNMLVESDLGDPFVEVQLTRREVIELCAALLAIASE